MTAYFVTGIILTAVASFVAVCATYAAFCEDDPYAARWALGLWASMLFLWFAWPLLVIAGAIYLLTRLVKIARDL